MKVLRFIVSTVAWLFIANAGYAATVSPIQTAYGNVFPTLTNQSLDVFRSSDPGPWYVSFNLLANADVKLGVQPLPVSNDGSVFDVTAIRLVTMEGANVKFGTDTFSTNPFSTPIEHLVVANALPAGAYALEISGVGNRSMLSCSSGGCGGLDTADFTTRLQVTVPLPTAIWLFGSGVLGLIGVFRRKRV